MTESFRSFVWVRVVVMKLLQTQHEGRQQDFGLVNVVHSLMVLLLVD